MGNAVAAAVKIDDKTPIEDHDSGIDRIMAIPS